MQVPTIWLHSILNYFCFDSMPENEKIILPEKYYLDNFNYVLDFVERKYDKLLSAEELDFIHSFRQLPENAQCLYVRISNRKGKFFRIGKLNYTEIEDLSGAHNLLMDAGYSSNSSELTIEETYQLISIFNKPEIVKIIKELEEEIDAKLPKAEFILEIVETIETELLSEAFLNLEPVIIQDKIETLDMIKLFFFGHNHGDMSDFVIRDIGNAKFIEIDESKLGQSFDTREEAEAMMEISLLNREYYLCEETLSPLGIFTWFESIDIRYYLDLEKTRTRAEKLIHKVGYQLERNKHWNEALIVYQLTNAAPMRERMIRTYNKQKDSEKALEVAHQILESPNNNKEYYIAIDMINKLDKKLKSTTVRQKEGVVIEVSQDYQYRVEQGTLAHFIEQGFEGVHSENTIWRTLFGLVFWQEIFDPKYNSLHQPLQRNPSDLYGKDFYAKRKDDLRAKLDRLKTKKQIINLMSQNAVEQEGISNPFVVWDADIQEATLRLVDFLQPKQIKSFLSEMMIDPKNRNTGFPDLFVWNNSTYHFYEVKSPTDHLSEQQLFWLEKFKEWQVNAEIALIRWS